MTNHRIAIIGGDGIGPEVMAEALKVVRAAGVDIDTVDFDLGGAPLPAPPARSCPTATLEELRGFDAILLGAVGTPEVPPGRARAGPAAAAALRARPLHQPAARSDGDGHRLRRDPREHRGHLRRRGRVPAQGHAPRGRHPGLGEHPHGRRALRALRLRAGPDPAAPAPHARAQDERAHLRRRPLAAHVRHRGRRVPRRRAPPTTTSTPPASTSCRTPGATT